MKTITLKKLIAIVALMVPAVIIAQEEGSVSTGPELVKGTFENNIHINNQTVLTHDKGYLDMNIQHRFGLIDKPSDLYGIYAPSNIRLYIGYGITKDISVGFGATKNKQLYDFSWKYAILKQKTEGMPVSFTYSGNLGIKGGEDKTVLNGKNEYSFTNRLGYYNELLVARKINKKISIQLGINYVHYNLIDSAILGDHFDLFGLSLIGRYKFSPQGSFLVEFDNPLNVSDLPTGGRPLPNLGIGVEFSTGYHQFQIFICNSNGILSQEAKFGNYNDFTKLGTPGYLIGFNITRQWGLGN